MYRPTDQNLSYFIDILSELLDVYAKNYERIVIFGDFNKESCSVEISHLMSFHNLSTLVNKPTCFKSPDVRCIDLILTNKRNCFQRSSSFETGISDFHYMIYTVLKTTNSNMPPKKVSNRCDKSFSETHFRTDLSPSLLNPKKVGGRVGRRISPHPSCFSEITFCLHMFNT